MVVRSIDSSDVIQPRNLVSIPNDPLRIILSYVLNLDPRSYVACLLSCKTISTAANIDQILPKKIVLIQMRAFCRQNWDRKLERPDEFDSENCTIIHYGSLVPRIEDILSTIALREAAQSVGVAKMTINTFLNEDLRKNTLEKLQLQRAPSNDRTKKTDKISLNETFAKEIAQEVLEGKILPEVSLVIGRIKKRLNSSLREKNEIFVKVVSKLAYDNLTMAENLVDSIPPRTSNIEPPLQEASLVEVLKVKAKHDSHNTFEKSLNLHYLNGTPAFPDIFAVILTCNPEIAEELALNLPRDKGQRNEALLKLIEFLVEKDIDKAWKYLLKIVDETEQKKLTSKLKTIDEFDEDKVIEHILNFANKNNPSKYKEFVSIVIEKQNAISDRALVVITEIEAQHNIPTAQMTAEKIRDPIKRGKAWIAILKALASKNPLSDYDIEEAQSHIPDDLFLTMITELVNINVDLAVKLLQNKHLEQKDEAFIQMIGELMQKDLPKAFELTMRISDDSERNDQLLYLIRYEANVQNHLRTMKNIVSALYHHYKFNMKHFEALEYICSKTEKWLKE